MKNLGKIDWTDLTRQGAHSDVYADNEIIDFLMFKESPVHPVPDQWYYKNFVIDKGYRHALFNARSVYWPSPTYENVYHSCYFTREWLPRNFVVDFWGQYWPRDSGQHFFFVLASDVGDFEEYINYGVVPGSLYSMPMFIRWGIWNTQANQIPVVRNLAGIIDYDMAQSQIRVSEVRGIFIRKNDYIYLFTFYETGEFKYVQGAYRDSEIYNPGQPDRFMMMGSTIQGGAYVRQSANNWYQLAVMEYQEIDWMSETDVAVTTTGSVVGAGTAKVALTTHDEDSYIELETGEEIIINLTTTLIDCDVWSLEIVANCTDTDPLLVNFNRADIQDVYTDTIEIGNTCLRRDAGVKIQEGWNNTIKHIFYPELVYLFRNDFSGQVGCKKIRIRNENVLTLRVHLVRCLKDNLSGSIIDTDDRINYGMRIEPGDAPLGTPGTVYNLKFRNSSGVTMPTVKLLLVDDGSPVLDGLIQYAAAPGGPWYDSASPPTDPEGVQIATALVDGGEANFYIRTNLPAADPQLASFISRFKFTATTA